MAAAVAVVATDARGATDVSWKTAANGLFNTGTNWVGNAVPGAGNNARFNLPGNAFTVTLGNDVTTAALFDNSRVNFDLGGHTWSLTSTPASDPLVVSKNIPTPNSMDRAELVLTHGTLAVTAPPGRATILGQLAGDYGSIAIGSGATLTTAGAVYVGQVGSGHIGLLAGSRFNASGPVTLGQGIEGGSMQVGDGAVATLGGGLSLGVSPLPAVPEYPGRGTASVLIEGTLIVNGGEEHIGEGGSAIIAQEGFGPSHTVNQNLLLGVLGGSYARYELFGGMLTVNGTEFIGHGGAAQFKHFSGTHRVIGNLYVGLLAGSSATYELGFAPADGTIPNQVESLTVTGDEVVGASATGTPTVAGATFTQFFQTTHTVGTAAVPRSLTIGESAGGTALYQASGGTLTVSGNLSVGQLAGSRGTLSVGGTTTVTVGGAARVGDAGTGTLNLTGGTFAVAGDLTVGGSNGSSGTVYVPQPTTVTVGGTLAVAPAAGATGSVTVLAGTLAADGLAVGGATGSVGAFAYSGTAAVMIGPGTPPAGSGSSMTIAAGHAMTVGGTSTVTAYGPFVDRGTITVLSRQSFTYAGVVPLVVAAGGVLAVQSGATAAFTGGTTLVNAGTVTVGPQGTLSIPAGGSNGGAVTNFGTLRAGGTLANTGGTFSQTGLQVWDAGSAVDVTGGTVTLGTDPGSASAAPLAASVATGGSLLCGSTDHFRSIALSAGGTVVQTAAANGRTVLVTGSLSFAGSAAAWQGRLDVGRNDLVGRGGSLSAVTSQAAQGFAGGAWNGSGGITSTAAAADPQHLTAVGVIQNNASSGAALYTTFDGQSVTATDVLARYTLYGDTNLDGSVTAADYTRLDAGFVTQRTGWFNGDFNYDRTVDGSDYALADNAYNRQTGGIGSPAAVAAAAVPEPAVAGSVAVAAMSLARRRRPR